MTRGLGWARALGGASGGCDPAASTPGAELNDASPSTILSSDGGADAWRPEGSGDTGELPACAVPDERLPGPVNLVPSGEREFPSFFEGEGRVTERTDVSFTIELEGCCAFQLQRFYLPDLFDVGETFGVRVGFTGGFNPNWGLTLWEADGRLRMFGYHGLLTRERFDALEPPFDVSVTESCNHPATCYSPHVSLSVRFAAPDAAVHLPADQAGTFVLDSRDYRASNYGSFRRGVVTGGCTDTTPPGDHVYIDVHPASLSL
jgi:hypothetical protein